MLIGMAVTVTAEKLIGSVIWFVVVPVCAFFTGYNVFDVYLSTEAQGEFEIIKKLELINESGEIYYFQVKDDKGNEMQVSVPKDAFENFATGDHVVLRHKVGRFTKDFFKGRFAE